MRMHIASTPVLILAITVLIVNCGISGVTSDKLVKTIPLSDGITSGVFSPDGKTLATVDRADLSSGTYAIKVIQTVDGHTKYSTDKYSVYALAFSPDGSMLAAGCRDGLRLFRSADGQLMRTVEGNQVFSAAFGSNGETVAYGGALGEVEVIRVSDGKSLQKYSVEKWITSLAFSSDGEILAAGTAANTGFVSRGDASTEDNSIFLWRVNANQALPTLTGHKHGVLSLSFSRDGKLLASGGSDGLIKLWQVGQKDAIKSHMIETGEHTISNLSFVPGSESLAVAYDNEIVVLQSNNLETLLTLKGHTGPVLSLHLDPDAKTVTSAGADKTIRLWRLA